ncbi:hypothetical protein E2C01_023653 [Portunus trituberculatus]|uniref:Uncharacterized protein n=1 Tax=Portunus trituberculatus TaxID=210409 RepID=A0A5B7E8H8_PORTR|nr:hypothetical protein [Portunus trituberculatus]
MKGVSTFGGESRAGPLLPAKSHHQTQCPVCRGCGTHRAAWAVGEVQKTYQLSEVSQGELGSASVIRLGTSWRNEWGLSSSLGKAGRDVEPLTRDGPSVRQR